MSRTFTIKELNEKIHKLIIEAKEDFHQVEDRQTKDLLMGKIIALQDLLIDLNDPEPLVNVTEKIQESLNIIETKKIIKDGL